MPLLYCLAEHNSLCARTWNRAGECPPNVEELGPDVWSPDDIKVLGTSVGNAGFEQTTIDARLEDESKLWHAVEWIPDLQCAWQVLVQCAGPRRHHLLRTLPPTRSVAYARAHDEGMMSAMRSLLKDLPGSFRQQDVATQLTTLPMRMGDLALRSASRMAQAAYWASRADALSMLDQRLPEVTTQISHSLSEDVPAGGCLGELQEAGSELDHHGFVSRPSWEELRAGARPAPPPESEPGEWPHGWQYFASSSVEFHFRKTVVLAESCAAERPTCVHILVQEAQQFCMDVEQLQSSSCNRRCFAQWFSSGCVCLCN